MNIEEKVQLTDDVEFIKKISDNLADTKKDAQHIRGTLNRIAKFANERSYYEEKYDDLLRAYCDCSQGLRFMADLLHLRLEAVCEPGTDNPPKYTLYIKTNDKDEEVKVDLTEEQYIAIARVAYSDSPEGYKKSCK